MDEQIRKFVYRIRGRLREQQVVSNLVNWSACGLLAADVISLTSLVVSFYYAALSAAVIVALLFAAGAVIGICKTPKPMQAALQADAKGYKEKISTAYFLIGREDAFSRLQKKDALQVMEGFAVKKEFPVRLPGKRVALLAVLALVFALTIQVDTPARKEARTKHRVGQEAKEDIARLEKVEKQIAEQKDISPKETEILKEQLKQAGEEIKEADTLAELKKAEERIAKKLEMAAGRMENETLSEIAEQGAKEVEDAATGREEELAKAAKEAMEQAENGSKKDKEKACESLEALADQTENEALEDAAASYRDSDYAQNEYKNAQKKLENALNGDGVQPGDKQEYAQGGNEQQQGGQNSSGSAGEGNGGANGQGGSGNDKGGQGQSTGSGWNKGSKEGGEGPGRTDESITVPEGEVGSDDNLTGKANSSGNKETGKTNQSSAWSGSKVNYGKVSGAYKEKAYKKVEGSNYPVKLKDRIKNYFDGLN